MSKFSRSWSLFKASVSVVLQNRKLIIFPLCSGFCSIFLFASFVVAPLINVSFPRKIVFQG